MLWIGILRLQNYKFCTDSFQISQDDEFLATRNTSGNAEVAHLFRYIKGAYDWYEHIL